MKVKNVFISSYTHICNGIRTNSSGPILPLKKFFAPKVNNLFLVEQPLPGSDSLNTQLTLIKDGVESFNCEKNFFFSKFSQKNLNVNKTYSILKIRDFFSNFFFFIHYFRKLKIKKFDLFIGVECINAISGVILKKLGFVDTVVYYIFDWAPDRYSNHLINKIYIFLDKIATYYADFTWNITYTIGEARVSILHYDPKRMSPQLYVPYCVDFDDTHILSEDQIDPNTIIYAGGLIEENGPELLINAFKLVLKINPLAKLLIIGGGPLENKIHQSIVKEGLSNSILMTGYVEDINKIFELQSKGAIGIAPYPIIKGSRKPFGDVIKIRMYFASGLVIVSTPVPPVSKEIKDEDLGFITDDDSPEELARYISLLLNDKDLLFTFRENVIHKAQQSNWSDNYIKTLRDMGLSIETTE